MHWDMEGTSGLFHRGQVWYYEKGVPAHLRRQGPDLFMADINAAVAAALDAGIDELIVCDTHHGGGNIVLERMLADPRVTYLPRLRGFVGEEYRWMPGLDETVDGCMGPAHHAKAGTPNTFLPHTWTLQWADFKINGQSVGEMGIEACFAAHWNIPLMLMSGDEVACAEAREQFPGIVAVPVKTPVDHDHCTGPDPETAHERIAQGIRQAVRNLRARKCKPFAPTLPMTVTVRMAKMEDADAASTRPGVERIDEFTVQAVLDQRADVVKWINGTGLNMEKPK